MIDFLLIDNSLQPLEHSCEVLRSWPSWPHKPVQLVFKQHVQGARRRVQVAPRELPVHHPIGCLRPPQPTEHDWAEVPTAGGETDLGVRDMHIDHVYGQLAMALEDQTLRLHDIVGEEAAKYKGRQAVPRWELRALIEARPHQAPRRSPATLWAKASAAALQEALGLEQAVGAGGALTAG